jgi:hypothetical protein
VVLSAASRLSGSSTYGGYPQGAGQRNNRRGETWRHFSGELQADQVELSSGVPTGFTLREMDEADRLADHFETGKAVSWRDENRLRQDRVFTALAALVLLYKNSSGAAGSAWPGMLPRPSAAELEAAYRKLSQRLRQEQTAFRPEEAESSLRQERRDLLDHFRLRGFLTLME